MYKRQGYTSEPRHLNTKCKTYERLVIAGHHMHRFHVRDQDIIDGFLERERNNDWKEGEERDDEAFLDLEQALWAEMYPDQARLRKEPEGDEVEECEVGPEEDEVGPAENEEGLVSDVIDLGENEESSVESQIAEGEEEGKSDEDAGC